MTDLYGPEMDDDAREFKAVSAAGNEDHVHRSPWLTYLAAETSSVENTMDIGCFHSKDKRASHGDLA